MFIETVCRVVFSSGGLTANLNSHFYGVFTNTGLLNNSGNTLIILQNNTQLGAAMWSDFFLVLIVEVNFFSYLILEINFIIITVLIPF